MKLIKLLPALAILALAAAQGCSADEVPDQLESLTMSAQGAGGDSSWEQLQADGVLSVTGEGREFHLDVGDGALLIDLHLPGMSDLTLLDGQTVSVALSRSGGPFEDHITITIEDESGPRFVASNQPGSHAAIGWGDVVAEEDVDGVVWGYTSVTVAHDGAMASLMPGDVASLAMDGSTWRVVPLAAYRVEDSSGQENDCILPSDLLGFEMLRMDTPAESPRVERPVGLPMVRALSCE